jgi:hypothetical protein
MTTSRAERFLTPFRLTPFRTFSVNQSIEYQIVNVGGFGLEPADDTIDDLGLTRRLEIRRVAATRQREVWKGW